MPLTRSPWVNVPPCPISIEQIEKAIAWHQAHREEITELLPVTLDGYHFGEDHLEIFDSQLLPRWQQWKDFKTTHTATTYLYTPIGRLFRELERNGIDTLPVNAKQQAA